jgi:hypothetical protein
MAAMRKSDDMASSEKRFVSSARGFGLRSSGNLCGLPQQGGIFPAEHFGAKTHSRVNLRLSEGTVSLSSVAQAFEQCLCPVIEILPKFRKGALCHFIYRAFTREIAANSDELRASTSATSFGSSTEFGRISRDGRSRNSRRTRPGIDSISVRSGNLSPFGCQCTAPGAVNG